MRIRPVIALGAGFLAALGLAGFPASAADAVVAAQSGTTSWSQTAVTINVGETVTWSTDGGAYHNVCVQTPGNTGPTCDEFRNGDPATDWSANAMNSHAFTVPGAYHFFCQAHPVAMTGTITVDTPTTGTTGTGTTETTTVPTQAQPAPAPADTTAPSFAGKLKRRASRKALTLEFVSTEAGRVNASVYRRPPHGRTFSRIGQASLKVKPGKNIVTVLRKSKGSLRSGSYRIKLQLVDVAGNKSGTRTLTFKLA